MLAPKDLQTLAFATKFVELGPFDLGMSPQGDVDMAGCLAGSSAKPKHVEANTTRKSPKAKRTKNCLMHPQKEIGK